MNVRQWLSRYLELKREALHEADEAGFWRDQASGIRASKLSFAPKSRYLGDLSDPIAKFLDIADHCAKLVEEADQAKREIEDVINSIDNTNYRQLLREKYIYGKNYLEIASDMHYSAGYVRRMASKAIKEVTQSNIYQSYNI